MGRGRLVVLSALVFWSGMATGLPAQTIGDEAELDRLQARAEEDCVLASLSRGDLESLLVTHAVIASKILLQLARQIGRQLRARAATERQPL